MKVETFLPPPSPPGHKSEPSYTWIREKLLISGITYLVCVSSECGRILLQIGPNENVEDFEKRVLKATPRIINQFGKNYSEESEFEDLEGYIHGYF